MNRVIRRFFLETPGLGYLYATARRHYHAVSTARGAKRYFINFNDYQDALHRQGPGTIDIRTADGLTIMIRRNSWDARILQEVFLTDAYACDVTFPQQPTIIDIGGYIGDFSLYAAKHLKARRVFVYEPSKKNFELLKTNVRRNNFRHVIEAFNLAVSNSNVIMMNIDAPDNEQANVSGFDADAHERQQVPSITLDEIIDSHSLETVDLLKIDCEGAEDQILLGASDRAFERIQNIVFEYHEIDGFKPLLAKVESRLAQMGNAVGRKGDIVAAKRPIPVVTGKD